MATTTPNQTSLNQTFTHNGYLLRWTSFGPEQAQPLIFIHGTPWSSRLWAPIALAISKTLKCRVYLFDNPGYGESHTRTAEAQNAPAAVSLADQTSAFVALAEHWRLEGKGQKNPIIVAHDFGGIIALRAHLLHDVQYAGLFLADVVATRPTGSPFFRLVNQNEDVFLKIPETIFKGMLTSYISEGSFKPLAPVALDGLCRPWLISETTRANWIHQVAQFDNEHIAEVEGRYKEVSGKMPVRIVWAKEDYWIPVERGVALAELMGMNEEDIIIVEEAGHLIMLDQPERVVAEIMAWLVRFDV